MEVAHHPCADSLRKDVIGCGQLTCQCKIDAYIEPMFFEAMYVVVNGVHCLRHFAEDGHTVGNTICFKIGYRNFMDRASHRFKLFQHRFTCGDHFSVSVTEPLPVHAEL